MTFQTGDRIQITFNGATVTGEVLLAAANGLSLTLILDEYLGGYINLMPVLWLDNTFVDLLLAEPVSISPMPQGAEYEMRPQALPERSPKIPYSSEDTAKRRRELSEREVESSPMQ
ncbi:MAG TPA: hypothetical protein VG488_14015 [Candidatus Angelobacter sp.]|nr:hypothetical protein [Candidatus Angelobacter sp.]